jgi:hypothetical protein
VFNQAEVSKIVDKYPELEVALLAGVVSMKMIRELIDVDRWLMQDIYKQLVMAGAVVGTSSSCFKATKECRIYLQERLVKKGVEKENDSNL